MKTYTINGKKIPRYYYSLFHIVEALFGSYSGTGDTLPLEEQDIFTKFLQARLEDWTESYQ